jgi:GNAT superfamily N-acetyltransferase
MIAEQEFEALKLDALNRTLGKLPDCQRSSSLLAVCSADEFAGRIGDNRGELEPELVIPGSAESSSSSSSSSMGSRTADGLQAAPQLAVVGTLDLYAVRALPGEVLIGNSQNPAYLANVCTASAARRRGVGQVLLEAGRRLAIEWGELLTVHLVLRPWTMLRLACKAGTQLEVGCGRGLPACTGCLTRAGLLLLLLLLLVCGRKCW